MSFPSSWTHWRQAGSTRAKRSCRPGSARCCRNEIEDWLDSKGVEWEFIEAFPVEQVDVEKGLNNQARVFTKLDSERVATYAEGVERGDAFPAVILHKSSRNKSSAIDGNHRIAAYQRANKATLPVYLVTKVQPRVLVMMTFEANVKHGLPTTHDERLYQAAWLMENGASEGQALAAVNVKAADVRKYWAKRKADTRSKEVGINRTVWDATWAGRNEPHLRPTRLITKHPLVRSALDVTYASDLAETLGMSTHSKRRNSARTSDDFWTRVDRRDPDGCWPYVGAGEATPSGHIRIWWRGAKCYAHRIAYVLAYGPIPVDGPIVRHRCDNPSCVRPAHICSGSVADNVRDRDERNRRTPFLPRGAAHWSAKLSEDDVREVRALRGRGVPAAVLARRYGVCASTIHNVWTGRHYPEAAAA